MVLAAVSGSGRLCDTLNQCSTRDNKSKKPRLQRRNTEEAVERAINEHLGDQSVLTVEVMKVDGISLKELGLDSGISMDLGWCWDVRGWGGVCFGHGYFNGFFLSGVGVVYLSGLGVTILSLRSWGGISFDHGYLNGLFLSWVRGESHLASKSWGGIFAWPWFPVSQERLLADKRKAKIEGKKLGSCYWAQLKMLYSVNDLEKVLKVANANEMVQQKLIEALRQACSTNTNIKSRSLLTTYFTQASSMNQKELCGVVKLLLRTKVKGNTLSCKCMLQFMKLCAKDKLNEKHPEEVDVLKDQFDEALMQPAMPLKQSATHVHTCVCYIEAYCM